MHRILHVLLFVCVGAWFELAEGKREHEGMVVENSKLKMELKRANECKVAHTSLCDMYQQKLTQGLSLFCCSFPKFKLSLMHKKSTSTEHAATQANYLALAGGKFCFCFFLHAVCVL